MSSRRALRFTVGAEVRDAVRAFLGLDRAIDGVAESAQRTEGALSGIADGAADAARQTQVAVEATEAEIVALRSAAEAAKEAADQARKAADDRADAAQATAEAVRRERAAEKSAAAERKRLNREAVEDAKKVARERAEAVRIAVEAARSATKEERALAKERVRIAREESRQATETARARVEASRADALATRTAATVERQAARDRALSDREAVRQAYETSRERAAAAQAAARVVVDAERTATAARRASEREATAGTRAIARAYKALGIQSAASLRAQVVAAREAVNLIRRDGARAPQELRRAMLALREVTASVNAQLGVQGGILSRLRTLYLGLSVAMRSAAVGAVSVGSSAATTGWSALTGVLGRAKSAFQSLAGVISGVFSRAMSIYRTTILAGGAASALFAREVGKTATDVERLENRLYAADRAAEISANGLRDRVVRDGPLVETEGGGLFDANGPRPRVMTRQARVVSGVDDAAVKRRLAESRKSIAEIRKISATISEAQATDAFLQLRNFGFDNKGAVQAARGLIEQNAAVGGSTDDLNGKILALGQAQAKQKLQGEEILQLVERGVPVWDLLQNVTGKSVAEIQKLSQAGKLGRPVIAALAKEIEKLYGGSARAQANTFDGLFAQLGARFFDLKKSIAASGVADALRGQLKSVLAFIQTPVFQQAALGLAQIGVSVIGALNRVLQTAVAYLSGPGLQILNEAVTRAESFAYQIIGTLFNNRRGIAGLFSSFGAIITGVLKIVDESVPTLIKSVQSLFDFANRAVDSFTGGRTKRILDKLTAAFRNFLSGLGLEFRATSVFADFAASIEEVASYLAVNARSAGEAVRGLYERFVEAFAYVRDEVVPIVQNLMKRLNPLNDFFNTTAGHVTAWTVALTFTAVELVKTATAIQSFASWVTSLSSLSGTFTTLSGWATALKTGFTAAMTAISSFGTAALSALAPFAIPISIGAAIIAAGVAIYVFWDDITKAASDAFDFISGALDDFAEWFKDTFPGLVDVADIVWDAVKSAGLAAFDALTDAFNGFWDFFASAGDLAYEKLKDLGILAKEIIRTVGRALGFGGDAPSGRTAAPGFARGTSYVRGPGTSTSDSILARLSRGEAVINASAVRAYGTDMMDAVNGMTYRPVAAIAAPEGASGYRTVVNLTLADGRTLPPVLAGDAFVAAIDGYARKSAAISAGPLPRTVR